MFYNSISNYFKLKNYFLIIKLNLICFFVYNDGTNRIAGNVQNGTQHIKNPVECIKQR